MNPSTLPLAPRPGDRMASAGVALGALAVLGLAAWLDPNPAGHGTHRQLGLPGCTFLTLTGWPCPLCGGTTTFALMADGRVLDGFVNHPVAALLFVTCLGVVGVGGAEALVPRGRWDRLVRAAEPSQAHLAVTFLVVLFAGWTYSIARCAGFF